MFLKLVFRLFLCFKLTTEDLKSINSEHCKRKSSIYTFSILCAWYIRNLSHLNHVHLGASNISKHIAILDWFGNTFKEQNDKIKGKSGWSGNQYLLFNCNNVPYACNELSNTLLYWLNKNLTNAKTTISIVFQILELHLIIRNLWSHLPCWTPSCGRWRWRRCESGWSARSLASQRSGAWCCPSPGSGTPPSCCAPAPLLDPADTVHSIKFATKWAKK